MAKDAKKKVHYINNKEFSHAVVDYVTLANKAKEEEKPIPIVTDYIATCFIKIAEGLSHRPNFIRYTYRDEMVMDGVENCLRAINNYKIETATRTGKPNAFSYFTQICYFAFIRRIQKEKKQLYIKYKTMESSPSLSENVEVSANDGDKGYNQETMNTDQKANMYNFIKNFEDAKKAKSVAKKPAKKTNLEYFMVA